MIYLALVSEDDKSILCREVSNKPPIEIEADRFAAALLMPATVVKEAMARQKAYRRIKSIGQARGLAATLIQKEGFSNVSNTAMVNRLIDLHYIPASLGYQDGVTIRRRAFRPSLVQLWKKTRHRVLKIRSG